MGVKRIVAILLALMVITLAAPSDIWAQSSEENTGPATQEDDNAIQAPDEEIGEAGLDPAQMLDAKVEPDPYAIEPVTEPAEAVEPAEAEETLAEDALLSTGIPVQGRLTNSSGSPLNGSFSIRFAFYTVSTGGTAVCVDTDTVPVANGLFTAIVDSCTGTDISGQQLYLGIKVGADPEMTPRQPVYSTPYARSLRPNAVINNTGAGHALSLQASGGGLANAALLAESSNTSGIAVWAKTDGSDATIVSSNNGTGILFKAFGGDGGEDEFRINNNGSVETKADSYLWIPGNGFMKYLSSDTTRWEMQTNGAVRIWRGATAGTKWIFYPITVPSVLYGQPVAIERITIYYKCENGANNYISETKMFKQTDAVSQVALISNSANHTNNNAASYTLNLTANNKLSASQGALGFYLGLSFNNDTDYIQIGGIRLQLGHHDLY